MRHAFDPGVAVIQPGFPLLLATAFLEAGVPTVVYLRDARFVELGDEVRPHPRLSYLACSRFIADMYLERFGIEAPVVPPLVRPDRYRVERAGRRVLFINPHPFKGVETALRLAERRPDIPFLFVECWDSVHMADADIAKSDRRCPLSPQHENQASRGGLGQVRSPRLG